jgi:YidC/Oxa1 family membrane protein insertase
MPVMFTFTMGGFASGLVIYWTWNNLLSIVQQWGIMTRAGVKFELWDNLRKNFGRA